MVFQEISVLQFVGDYSNNVQGCVEALKDDVNVYTVMAHYSETRIASLIETLDDKTTLQRDSFGWFRPNEEKARGWFKEICNVRFFSH
jgi:hypothetical protein